uniref:Uncharacterized protein n=1 Tax=Oryza rufipogon TaxID=4529 RepID=A0A0E0NJ89_ORYRU
MTSDGMAQGISSIPRVPGISRYQGTRYQVPTDTQGTKYQDGEEVEVLEHVAAGVVVTETPRPLASSASVAAEEEPPALTGKEATGAAGKDDNDFGEEREGGGERPRRRQRRER